jgi:hypothetical protein
MLNLMTEPLITEVNQQDLPKATAEKNLLKGLNKFSFTGRNASITAKERWH